MLHDKYRTEMFRPEFVPRNAVTHVPGGKKKIIYNKHSAGAYYVV